MAMNQAEKYVYDSIKNSYPCGIRKWEEPNGALNDFDEVRAKVVRAEASMVEQAANQLIVQTANGSGMGLRDWEYFLKIPIITTDSEPIRRARILAKIAGTPTTIGTLKRVLATIINDDTIDFDIFEYWQVTSNPYTIFWYNIIIYDSSFVYDLEQIRAILKTIHPYHCDLNWIVAVDDFWQWDNPLLPLDDFRYGTNWLKMPITGSFEGDLEVFPMEDSNVAQLDLIIDSLQPRDTFYCRPAGGLKIKLAESNNVYIGNKFLKFSDEIISNDLPLYAGIILVYARWNGGMVVIETMTDADFTPGDPETYYISPVGQNIYPIAEIDMTLVTTDITENEIVDVRQQF